MMKDDKLDLVAGGKNRVGDDGVAAEVRVGRSSGGGLHEKAKGPW